MAFELLLSTLRILLYPLLRLTLREARPVAVWLAGWTTKIRRN
jgi:hypothetical protein